MAAHRFKLGQKVTAHALGVPVGPYVIIRLLPLVGNDPHYQAKSEAGTAASAGSKPGALRRNDPEPLDRGFESLRGYPDCPTSQRE